KAGTPSGLFGVYQNRMKLGQVGNCIDLSRIDPSSSFPICLGKAAVELSSFARPTIRGFGAWLDGLGCRSLKAFSLDCHPAPVHGQFQQPPLGDSIISNRSQAFEFLRPLMIEFRSRRHGSPNTHPVVSYYPCLNPAFGSATEFSLNLRRAIDIAQGNTLPR